jgi:hypothetical protein
VVFRASLEAGAIQPQGAAFVYANPAAVAGGGISKVKFLHHGAGYVVTVYAYGDLSASTTEMTTHVFVGAQEWTLAGHWLKTSHGWHLETLGSQPPA